MTVDADGFALIDLSVADGLIAGLVAAGGPPGAGAAAGMRRSVLFPAFVDLHTHIGACGARARRAWPSRVSAQP